MSEPGLPEPALTAGLLMEGAQAQQQLAASALAALRAHTAGLDTVVRDEIQRTLIESLAGLQAEVARVTRQLEASRTGSRWTRIRVALSLVALGIAAPVGARWWLPSPASVAALESREADLKASIARLRRAGGGVQLHPCGTPVRLCVHIDARAPRFGAAGDFAVVAEE